MSVLLHPGFLAGAGVIVLGALVAWYAGVGRHRLGRPRGGSAPRPVPQRAAGAGGEAPAPADADPGGPSGPDHHPSVTFDDVAGLEEAVTDLAELEEYLSAPERFRAVGADLPRGVLLHGPPGNGKTLLARALAGETGVPFHAASAAGFVEQYVGVGAARIRSLFEQAREQGPSIVFIDELDAVGRRRSGGEGGGREFDHTLNQLLVELDGAQDGQGVLIVGATNRPGLLDDALTRPGRFDRRIAVPRPDLADREAILRLHGDDRPVAAAVDWGTVAAETAGLSAAELAGIVNEAALLTARRRQRWVTPDAVDEAVARVRRGTRRTRLLDERDKHRLAVHEGGQAVLSVLLRDLTPPRRASIVARAGARRSPWAPATDREVMTRRELMARLIGLLGGRAAEQLVLGEPSTRAEHDLEEAAGLARRMVTRWAMTGRYELADRDAPTTGAGPGVRRLVAKAERAARTILEDHAGELRRVVEELRRHETVRAARLTTLVAPEPDRDRPAVSADSTG